MKQFRLEARLRCIASMLVPYKDFVASSQVEVMENCFDMWWDLVAGDYWRCVNIKYKSDEIMARVFSENYENLPVVPDISWEEISDEERAILNQMLTTLTEILALGEVRCEQYALHGLGHLPHPERAQTVQKFIDENADNRTNEALEWMKRCRDGTVM